MRIPPLTNRLSLRWVLIGQVLAPLLAAMLIFTAIGLHTLESALEKRLQEDVELVARAVRLPISDSLERGQRNDVRQALESVFRIGRVYGAYVYDVEGELVAAVGAVNPTPRTRDVARMAAEGERQGAYEHIQGQEVYSYFVPLSDSGGRISGLLQVTRRGSDFQQLVTALRWQAAVVIAVAGGVMSLLVLVGHRRAIGRYFDQLVDSMARVEAGEREHRAPESGPREIQRLTGALNTMLDGVNRAEQEVAARREAQRSLEEELRQTEKLAAIGRLASGVAHELGTPLSVIDGKAQRALRRTESGGLATETLTQIRGEVSRMEHIVRQLLEFGRARNRNLREARLGVLVSAAATALEPLFREKGVALKVDAPSPDPEFRADPVRLEQVLVNLLRNAIQAGAHELLVEWSNDADAVMLRVHDDGAGVPEGDRPRLFEPFFTTKSVGEGTGLGLAVVHGIVKEHGGDVEVTTSVLGGACFQITLPLTGSGTTEEESYEEQSRT